MFAQKQPKFHLRFCLDSEKLGIQHLKQPLCTQDVGESPL